MHIVSAITTVRARIKQRVGPLWWYTGLQFGFSKVADVVNLYVGAFIVPAVISSEDLGAIVPFRMIIAFLAIRSFCSRNG